MSGANAGTGVRRMHLAVELPGDGWGSPAGAGTAAGAGASPRPDFAAYVRLARTAERGLFDFLLLTDRAPRAGRRSGGPADAAVRSVAAGRLEPVTVLNALAAVTEHIGLAAVLATAGREPYELARRIAALDLLSGGRAAGPAIDTVPEPAARRSPQGRPVVIEEGDGGAAEVVVRDGARGSARSGVRVLVRVGWVLDEAGAGVAVPVTEPIIGSAGSADAPAAGKAPGKGTEGAAGDGLEHGAGGAVFTGSARAFAARLDGLVQSGSVDGFVLRPGPDSGPGPGGRGLDAFVDRVVPLLQQRGCLRTAYRGTTLREHLGLPRPTGRLDRHERTGS